VVTWHDNERHTNRHGAVFLMTDGDSLHEPTGYVPIPPTTRQWGCPAG